MLQDARDAEKAELDLWELEWNLGIILIIFGIIFEACDGYVKLKITMVS